MTRLLFVCTRNRLRSPTAEAVFFCYEGIEAISAGTNNDAETPVSADLIDWADIVFVMEKVHRSRIAKKFEPWLRDKRVVVLGIPDNFAYMDPELIRLLEARVARFAPLELLRKKAD